MTNRRMKYKEKRYILGSVLAWLYLYTIGLFLPKKCNLWAEKLINKSVEKKTGDNSDHNQKEIDLQNETTNLKKYDSGISLDSFDEKESLNSNSENSSWDKSQGLQSLRQHNSERKALSYEVVSLNEKIDSLINLSNKQNKEINSMQDTISEKNKIIFTQDETILTLKTKINELENNNTFTNSEITKKHFKDLYTIAYEDDDKSLVKENKEGTKDYPSTNIAIIEEIKNHIELSNLHQF